MLANQTGKKNKTGRGKRLLASVLASGVLLLSATTASAEVIEDTLRIGYQKYGTLILLKARGTLDQQLAEQGVEVKWIEFPAGPQLLEGLNVGSVDFGTTGETPPIFAQAAGADLVYVANEPPAPKGEAILVQADSPIQSVADLRGKTVALNKGSNVHYLLVRALEEAGLTIRDIKPVYIKPGDARAAFDQGNVDAWVIWDPYQADAELAGARSLRDGEGLVDNHQFYLASRSFAERYPAIVNTVIESLAELDAWAKDHPEEVVEILHGETGISRESLRLSGERYSYGAVHVTPQIGQAQQTIADVFYELNLIPRQIDISSVLWSESAPVAQRAE